MAWIIRLDSIYLDIKKNPHLQVSGLKTAKTKLKIPRIKRNKENLKQLLKMCIEREAKVSAANKHGGVIDRMIDRQKLFKFDLPAHPLP